ncbi:MAG: TolC family outer membrane protein [Gammaproteobacteria bacterium]|nr:TolC family outer membrane protein [Gammaproteobacteria bacterium]MBT4606485.1 TolC family outer membrane protein [Thiotrichales bacterium]MBT7828819.1 TolC family outer membrane protein [Candidatus Neomarinimicrobiota bacterium]MBT4328813.1 TolC family outer membrane protein [Gammaproteobacteria bacterium]MBT5746429.1 TolC family outer membrane protein [Gammaproteobacteria bacterium]
MKQNQKVPFKYYSIITLMLITMPAASMDLMQIYQLALQNDPLWQVSQAEAMAGRESLPQAEAQLRPSLTLSGSHSRVQQDQEQSGVTLQQRHYDSESLTLNLTQSLFNKPGWARLQRAEAQQREVEATLVLQKGELLERVITSYFSVLMADDVIEQLQSQEHSNRAQLEAATRSYELGQGTRTDIDEAQARLDMVTVQRLQAQQQSRYARTELSVLAGQPVEILKILDTTALIPLTPKQSLEQLMQLVESTSSRLQVAKSAVEVAQQQFEEVKGERYPKLDLFLQHSYSESDSVNTVGSQYDTAKIGLQFNLPLYDGGGISSRIRETASLLQRAQAQQQQTLYQLQLEVRKQFQSVKETTARISALKQVVRSARQLVQSTRKGITAGTRTTIDWLNARQQESDAIQQLSAAQYEYLLSTIRLEKLAGRESEAILMKVNGLLISPSQRQPLFEEESDTEQQKREKKNKEVAV